MSIRNAIRGLVVLALAGCAGFGGPAPATQESLLTASAVVESVNHDSRQVRLRDDSDSTVFTVTAGPEVRNLDQLQAGDRVQLDFYEAVTVAMADPADPGDPLGAVVAGRAPEGARPGGIVAVTESVVVQVVSYDANSGLATYRLPDGSVRRTTIAPELRSFAASRRPGDRVAVTITEAVAVTIAETAA